MCLVSDLEEIGLPSLAAERIAVHFGKILPGSVLEHERAAVLEEPMPEDPSELDLSEPRLTCSEPDEPEPEPEPEPKPDEHVSDALRGETKVPLSVRGKEDVNVLLVAEKLEKYSEAVVEAGYSFVGDLLAADDEEIAELAKDVQMKKRAAPFAGGRSEKERCHAARAAAERVHVPDLARAHGGPGRHRQRPDLRP